MQNSWLKYGFCFVSIVLLVACQNDSSSNQQSQTNSTATTQVLSEKPQNPAFEMKGKKIEDQIIYDENKQAVKLSSVIAKDKLTYLSFFVSWCPHCQKQYPFLESLSKKYDDKIKIVMLNSTTEDISGKNKTATDQKDQSFSQGLNYVKEHHYNVNPVYFDSGRVVTKYFQVNSFPAAYLIKPDGTIANIILGNFESEEAAEKAFNKLINETK